MGKLKVESQKTSILETRFTICWPGNEYVDIHSCSQLDLSQCQNCKSLQLQSQSKLNVGTGELTQHWIHMASSWALRFRCDLKQLGVLYWSPFHYIYQRVIFLQSCKHLPGSRDTKMIHVSVGKLSKSSPPLASVFFREQGRMSLQIHFSLQNEK